VASNGVVLGAQVATPIISKQLVSMGAVGAY